MAEGREAGEAAAGAEPGGLAAVDVVLELLEAAFHSILFLRELYPPREYFQWLRERQKESATWEYREVGKERERKRA